jgi:glycosyltransferase involved in cell wall biosynthesis
VRNTSPSTERSKAAPLVSVLVSNYNYGRFIREAIESVLSQTYPNTEIIVVDDGSTDNSRAVIDGYHDRLKAIYKENRGHASAINAAFEASTGDIICLLDADDSYHPEKISKVVACYQERREILYVFHALRRVDINGTDLGINEPMDRSRWLDHRVRRFIAPPTSGLTFRRSGWELLEPVPHGLSPIADNYLKFVIMGLARGYYLAEPLGVMKIHGDNMFSMGNWGTSRFPADIKVAAAMRANFPQLVAKADRLVSVTLANYWHLKRHDRPTVEESEKYLARSSSLSKMRIYGGAVLRFCRQYLRMIFAARKAKLSSSPVHAQTAYRKPHD